MANDPGQGTTTQIDVPVYAGTYQENLKLPDDSWHLHPCVGTPVLTANGGNLITLDVNAVPEKFITIERFTFSGTPVTTALVWGCGVDPSIEMAGLKALVSAWNLQHS